MNRSLADCYVQRDFPAFQRLLVPQQKGSTKVSSQLVNRLDLRGKAVLHHAVSSTEASRWDYTLALLACSAVNVNLQDAESGWTPLHRAVYYGNLEAARALIAHANIDLSIRDNEGLTAFDLYNASVDGVNPQVCEGQSELFAWGSNRNFTLGFKGDSDRSLPERVWLAKTPAADQVGKQGSFGGVNVRDVAMSKFQTGAITDEKSGNVRFCGSATDSRMGKNATTRFTFESLPGFQATIVQMAVATDHTLLLDERGDVFTLGMNHHGQLGYPLEGDETLQSAPKRVIGLRKERVVGIAASRVHSVAFTEESLYTWGASRGQLGYATPGSSTQGVPRKVSTLPSPVRSVVATEYATVCLLESHDVFVFQKNAYFKMVFSFQRFPQSKQIYRPPQLAYESKPIITKIAGCGTNLVALSEMGDVFWWTLDDTDTPQNVVSRSPQRVWDRRKNFTGVVDVAVGNDTLIMATVSGHVYVRQKRMDVIKGADLRGGNAASTSNRKLHKVTRMPFLQRVVRVAANDSGGFAALRADAPIAVPSTAGKSLSSDLAELLPHLKQAPKTIDILRDADSEAGGASTDAEDRDPAIEAEVQTAMSYVNAAAEWNDSWSEPRCGADVALVTKGGKEVPAHKSILAARSAVFERVLSGKPANSGESISLERVSNEHGQPRISMRRHSLLAVLLLLHHFYTDSPLALWDPRLAWQLKSVGIASLRDELHALAHLLQLPALARVLALPERTLPEPTLTTNLLHLLRSASSSSALRADCVLELADGQQLFAHQAVLRARCPFFAAMFSDFDWTAERRGTANDGMLTLDLRSLDIEVMQMVLKHVYGDIGIELFKDVVRPTSDAYIDFVFQVIAAANELLLDRLKAVCSAVLSSFIHLQNVAAILSDADFYHADDLAASCMLYLSRNMETALEGRYLDDFPVALLRRLSAFCRTRQVEKLPISRSEAWINDLLAKHVDYFENLDLAKPVTGKRKWKFTSRSPRLSPADVPLPASLPNAPSPLLQGRRISSAPSPLLEALSEPLESPPGTPSPILGSSLPEEAAFPMDELEGVTSPTAKSRSAPWTKLTAASEIPSLDLRDIMAKEETRHTPQRPRLSSEASSGSTPLRMSQKDRKRQPADMPTPSPPASASPWRPPTTPGWRLAEAAKASSLSSIQSEQLSSSPKPRATQTPTPPAARRPPLQPVAAGSSPALPQNKASAVGAPVITPVRSASANKPRPSVSGGQDGAWVNYASASTSFFAPSPSQVEPTLSSFASIQNQQHDEGEAIRNARKAPKSLAEIQEEEAFMRWWAEESAKAQPVAQSTPSPTERGGRGGRGRGARGGQARGGRGQARGRGSKSGRGSVIAN